jgi:FkbM family methyltransferase
MLRHLATLLRSVRIASAIRRDDNLPKQMRSELGRVAVRVENTTLGRLPNPMRVLGFHIGYLGEEQFRYLLHEIFFDGCYRFRIDNESPTIIDCGSNIGMSVLFFKALYPDARIMAFEPDPDTFQQLSENIRINNLSGIDLRNVALSSQDMNIEFFISSEAAGVLTMSADPNRISDARITVPAKRLSSFIPEHVDLMKVDIEGLEYSVLSELENSDVLRRIDRIHLEYHHHIRLAEDKMSEMLNLLERSGFGYQIQARSRKWPSFPVFQDIAIFAYRKSAAI